MSLSDFTPTPHRSTKNTKRWCKGIVGREHEIEIRVSKWPYQTKCEPSRYWSGWFCVHQYVCTRCSKVMQDGLGRECPKYRREE